MSVPAQNVDTAFNTILSQVSSTQVDPDVGMSVIAGLSKLGQELRLWVDNANALGHHATTIALLKAMVAYGFSAPVRILFSKADDAKKLELLLPGYKAGDATLTYGGVQITFQYTQTPPSAPATLLLSGGSDAGETELKTRLAAANCTFYLQLQPWNWKQADLLIYKGQGGTPTVVPLRAQASLRGSQLTWCAYTSPAVARDDKLWDLYGALPRFQTRVAMAKLLADAAPGKYVLPVYGLERMNMWGALLTLVLGGVTAQDLMSSRKIPVRPIVLLVFNSIGDSDWWPLLGEYMAGTATTEDYPEVLKDYVQQHQIAKRVILNYGLKDNPAALSKQLASLTGNQLLAVGMEGTPDEIFRYFYSTASLPFVFEGRGTQSLALNLGRPYLCSEPTGYPSAFFDDTTPPAAAIAQTAVLTLNRLDSAYEKLDPATWPSAVFADSLCKLIQDQQAIDYFAALGKVYGAPQNDKLRMTLRFLRSIPGFPA